MHSEQNFKEASIVKSALSIPMWHIEKQKEKKREKEEKNGDQRKAER